MFLKIFKLIVPSLALAGFGASGQAIGDLPACARIAALQVFREQSCQLDDFHCSCSNQTLLDVVGAAWQQSCSPGDDQRAQEFATSLCLSAVQITITMDVSAIASSNGLSMGLQSTVGLPASVLGCPTPTHSADASSLADTRSKLPSPPTAGAAPECSAVPPFPSTTSDLSKTTTGTVPGSSGAAASSSVLTAPPSTSSISSTLSITPTATTTTGQAGYRAAVEVWQLPGVLLILILFCIL